MLLLDVSLTGEVIRWGTSLELILKKKDCSHRNLFGSYFEEEQIQVFRSYFAEEKIFLEECGE